MVFDFAVTLTFRSRSSNLFRTFKGTRFINKQTHTYWYPLVKYLTGVMDRRTYETVSRGKNAVIQCIY